MKGWIKVHGYLKHDERFIKASAITTVGSGVRADDETDTVTCLILDGDGTPYGVTESVEEVLALIEKAESGEEETTQVAVVEADELLAWLGNIKEEAERVGGDAYVAALEDVIQYVEREKLLADKPADTEEE